MAYIGIMTDRSFDKNKPSFIKIYYTIIISQPYYYIIVDNKADAPARRQIIANVFKNCVYYNITGVDSAVPDLTTRQTTKAIYSKRDSLSIYNDEDNPKISQRDCQIDPIVVHPKLCK